MAGGIACCTAENYGIITIRVEMPGQGRRLQKHWEYKWDSRQKTVFRADKQYLDKK